MLCEWHGCMSGPCLWIRCWPSHRRSCTPSRPLAARLFAIGIARGLSTFLATEVIHRETKTAKRRRKNFPRLRAPRCWPFVGLSHQRAGRILAGRQNWTRKGGSESDGQLFGDQISNFDIGEASADDHQHPTVRRGTHGAGMQTESVVPAMLTISGAMAYSGFSRSRIYAHLKRRELEARKAGRRTLIVRSSLDRLLAELPKAA